MSITRVNEFSAAEGKSEELYDFLKSLVPYISSSEGCYTCEVLKSIDADNEFVVIEKWESIESHKASIEKFPKENMKAAMSLFSAPPQGRYFK